MCRECRGISLVAIAFFVCGGIGRCDRLFLGLVRMMGIGARSLGSICGVDVQLVVVSSVLWEEGACSWVCFVRHCVLLPVYGLECLFLPFESTTIVV